MPPRNSRKPYHVVNSLSNVNKNRVDWKLPLRACGTWVVPPFQGGPKTLKVLFADVEGNRVQATIRPYLVEKFGHHISMGSHIPASDIAFKINFVMTLLSLRICLMKILLTRIIRKLWSLRANFLP